ncbi:cellulase family glycosylhydrolase, partial [candidate division KSB1 bacterium]|nr:cellulase family glycosylhydrolase [candidate division KSB1 bacterium]
MRLKIVCLFISLWCQFSQLFATPLPGYYSFQTHFGQFTRADMDSLSMEAMLDQIQTAGFTAIRDECYWSEVEKTKGQYLFPQAIDHYILAAQRRGIEVLLILNYNNPLYAPHAGTGITTDSNRVAFARYCEATVKRYLPLGITHFEIWNEPNIPIFWDPTPNPADYALLLKTVYPIIKQIDPTLTVIGCATSPAEGNPAPFISGLYFIQGVFQNGGGNYLDAVSFHQYHVDQRPESNFFTDIQKLQAIIGTTLPIWLTEVGYPTNTGWPNISLETQANYITRLFLLGHAAPLLKRISYYDLKNDGLNPAEAEHNFGVLFFDRQPKPAYHALKTLTSLVAAKPLKRSKIMNNYYQFEFGAGPEWVTALWQTTGQSVQTVKMGGIYARLIARDGMLQNYYIGADSLAKVTVTEKPQYLAALSAAPQLTSLEVSPARIWLYPGQTVALQVTGYDQYGLMVSFSVPSLDWKWEGIEGLLSPAGAFQATQTGNGYLIARYQQQTDSVAITVVNPGEHLIDDFLTAAHWKLTTLNLDTNRTRFTIDSQTASLGMTAGRLDYELTYKTNIHKTRYQAYLSSELLLPGMPDTLMLDVYGNGHPHRFEFQFHDQSGKNFTKSASDQAIVWANEWRTVKIGLTTWQTQVTLPLYLDQITIYIVQNDAQADSTYTGKIFIDQLRAQSNRTCVPSPKPTPDGNFFLAPNYPNPFNPHTLIGYYLPSAQAINLKI